MTTNQDFPTIQPVAEYEIHLFTHFRTVAVLQGDDGFYIQLSLHNPGQNDHQLRRMPITDYGAKRSPITAHADH